jgi:1-deoxy-D-xylulose-5-phosphate synthase
MFTAAYGHDGPFVIRYPRGQGVLCDWECKMEKLEIGKGRKLKNGKDLAVLTIGPIGNAAREAIAVIESEGYSIAHYDMIFLKPIDKALLKEVAENFENVMTIENGVETGGLGSAVLEYFSENNYHNINVTRVGLPDEFVTHGSIKELNKLCEIDAPGLAKRMRETLIRYNIVPQQHENIYK